MVSSLLQFLDQPALSRLSDAAPGRAIPNGAAATWTAADLARGIPVAIAPQERLLLRLDAAGGEPPAYDEAVGCITQ